eukprot:Gb_05646 [translate_table: standard]
MVDKSFTNFTFTVKMWSEERWTKHGINFSFGLWRVSTMRCKFSSVPTSKTYHRRQDPYTNLTARSLAKMYRKLPLYCNHSIQWDDALWGFFSTDFWIASWCFSSTFWDTQSSRLPEPIDASFAYHSRSFGRKTFLLLWMPMLAWRNSFLAVSSSLYTFFSVYTRTAGSEIPPLQRAKQTRGSGSSRPNVRPNMRRSSPSLNLAPVERSVWSHCAGRDVRQHRMECSMLLALIE